MRTGTGFENHIKYVLWIAKLWNVLIVSRAAAFGLSCAIIRGPKIKVLSWNLLAPCYVKTPPPSWRNDPSFDPDWAVWLDWEYRKTKITSVLAESGADVVCLQEVETRRRTTTTTTTTTTTVMDDFELIWDKLGYTTHVQETRGDYPVANVILISKALNWKVVFQESRSRAMILMLQPNHFPNRHAPPLILVNVHLQASGRYGFQQNAQTRYSQVQSLLKRINLAWTRIQKEQEECSDWGKEPDLLMMGDFNLSPCEPLYSLLVQGTWPDDKSEYKHFLPAKVSKCSASSLPFLPLRDVRRQQKDNDDDSTTVKNESQQQQQQPPQRQWTYAPTQNTFDYIFATNSVEIIERYNYPLPSDLTNVPSLSRLFWPNKFHPSDHIPIGATVQFQPR